MESRNEQIRIERVTSLSPELYDAIAQIWEQSGVGNPARGDTLDAVRATLQHGGIILVSSHNGEIAGTAWLTHDFRRIYVHHMGVKPSLQNQGIGRALLVDALQIARELGYQAKLEVHADNPAAIKLYRSCGFEVLEGYLTMINRKVASADA